MLRFGIEIEFLVNPESVTALMNVLDKYKETLLVRNKEFKGKTFLFTDSSVSPSSTNNNSDTLFHYGFEIKTKKLEFNTENFNKFKEFFEDLSKVVYSNETCGLHVHCSRKWFSLKDHFALLYEYIKNESYKKFLEVEGHKMSCFTYANLSKTRRYYYNRVNKAIKDESTIIIDTCALERKVDLYKVHLDYNSIEFRGLRGHFSKCSNDSILSTIKEYLEIMESLRYDKDIKNVFSWEQD